MFKNDGSNGEIQLSELLNFTYLNNFYSKNDKYEKLFNKLAPFTDKAHSGLTQRKNEIIELWTLFDRIQPHVIVELGVAQGGTFASWCQLAPDGHCIIGIDRDLNDCWPRKGNDVHPDIADKCDKMTEDGGGLYQLRRRGSNQRIFGIKGWSYEPNVMRDLLGALQGRQIDFFFHDASHKCEETEADFELFWPLIKPGGVMAFHDVSFYTHEGASKYEWFRKIRDDGPQIVLYSYTTPDRAVLSMGIAILFKAGEGNE